MANQAYEGDLHEHNIGQPKEAEKEWRPYAWCDRLPETTIRPAEPHVDLPEWVEGVLVAVILAIVVGILLLTVLPAVQGHPAVSQ